MIITISGKMFSGKDTLADLLAPRFEKVHRFTFSDLICAEGNPALEIIREHPQESVKVLGNRVAQELNLDPDHGAAFVAAVIEDALNDPTFTLRRRTEGTRYVLQHLGSDWRPDGYWANIVFKHACEHEAMGETVIMVGARYPAEHDLFTDAGALTIRLDVSRDVQIERALNRDGAVPREGQFTHPGEILLDDATFALRVDTDPLSPEEVCDKTVQWLEAV